MTLVFLDRTDKVLPALHIGNRKPIYTPDPVRGWSLEDLRYACEKECPKGAKGAQVYLDENFVVYLYGYYI